MHGSTQLDFLKHFFMGVFFLNCNASIQKVLSYITYLCKSTEHFSQAGLIFVLEEGAILCKW